jgi:hypothetical protein
VLGIAKGGVELVNEVGLFQTLPGPPLGLGQGGDQGLRHSAGPHIDLDGVMAAAAQGFQA